MDYDPVYGVAALQPVSWIVALGIFASFLLAASMGANDVANAFGTSCGSKVLSLRQACVIAGIMNFAGVMLLGKGTASTIAKGVVDIDAWKGDPSLLMLLMFCTMVGAQLLVFTATRFSIPVSTTHAVVGALVGCALVFRADSVQWYPEMFKIILSWFVSPVLSGGIAVILFLAVRHFVLRKDAEVALARARPCIAVCMSLVAAVITVFVSYKLSDYEEHTAWKWGGALLAVAVGLTSFVLLYFFVIPAMFRRLDASFGLPNLKACCPAADTTKGATAAADGASSGVAPANGVSPAPYVRQEDSPEASPRASCVADASETASASTKPVCTCGAMEELMMAEEGKKKEQLLVLQQQAEAKEEVVEEDSMLGSFLPEMALPSCCWRCGGGGGRSKEDEVNAAAAKAVRLEALHGSAEQFDPFLERRFAAAQVLSASFEAFSQGANDIANVSGPLMSIWSVYQTGVVSEKSDLEYWVMVLGSAGIIFGLSTWGSRVIRTLGTKVTKVTPSRGFAIEFGTASAVLIASFLGIPVSTTHCCTGAVFAIGLVNPRGQGRVVNWRLMGKIALSWVITLPAAGLMGAALFAGLRNIVERSVLPVVAV